MPNSRPVFVALYKFWVLKKFDLEFTELNLAYSPSLSLFHGVIIARTSLFLDKGKFSHKYFNEIYWAYLIQFIKEVLIKFPSSFVKVRIIIIGKENV